MTEVRCHARLHACTLSADAAQRRVSIRLPQAHCQPYPQGASTAKAAAAAVALGVTASGCAYLLYRSSGGSSSSSSREHAASDSEQQEPQPVKITTLGQLQQYSGLRGRLNAALASVLTPPHVVSAVVPNQGAALPAFPQYLCSLGTLTQVNLSGAAIAELPPQIGALRHLKDLDLGKNQLARLPDEIGQLTALKFLNLMCNQVRVKKRGEGLARKAGAGAVLLWHCTIHSRSSIHQALDSVWCWCQETYCLGAESRVGVLAALLSRTVCLPSCRANAPRSH